MTKVLAGGVSPFDIRRNKVPAGSGAVRINYMNKNSERVITKYPVVAFDSNGRYSSEPSRGIPHMQHSELRANIPTQRWSSKAAGILQPKEPVTKSTGVQTDVIIEATPRLTPKLPSGTPKIPVSSQGVPISTQTDMFQPADPSPRVDAAVQTWHTGGLEPSSQIVNHHYHQNIPVTNVNTTNQQFVNNQVDQSTTNQQVVNVDNTQQQQIINNTVVQQELTHLVDNRLQLLIHQNNLTQNAFAVINDPSNSAPIRPVPQQFQPGTQIALDQQMLMDAEMSISPKAIEYPSNWLATQTNPSMIEEPSTPSGAMTSFDAPRPVPTNRQSTRNRRKKRLQDVTNTRNQ